MPRKVPLERAIEGTKKSEGKKDGIMRRILSMLLCLAMLCVLCAGAAVAEGEKKQFEIWLPCNTQPTEEDNEMWYYLINGFQTAYPDYEVIVTPIGENSDDYNAKWQMAAASNNLPDMLYASVGYVDDWANAGLLLNLEGKLDAETMERFVDGAVEYTNAYNAIEGIYGLPTRAETQGWFFNTDLFEQVGLEIPKTWTEWMNCINVFLENGIQPIQHGGLDIWSIWGYHAMFCNYGLDYDMAMQLQNRELKFADCDAFVKTFERIAEMAAAGAYNDDVATLNDSVANARFAAGECAMYNGYDSKYTAFVDMLATGESDIANHCVFGFGPDFEDGPEGYCGIRTYGWTLMCSSKLEQDADSLEAAMAFLKYFFSEEGTQIVEQYQVPATEFTVQDTEDQTMLEASIYESYLADITPVPDSNQVWFDQSIKPTYRNAVTGLICGTLTVDEALRMMQDWADTM